MRCYSFLFLIVTLLPCQICGAGDDISPNLHYAAEIGSVEIVQDFLGYGVEVNVLDKHGRTPLHYAAMFGHEEVVKILLAQAGVKRDIKDQFGYEPVFYAKNSGYDEVEGLFKAV